MADRCTKSPIKNNMSTKKIAVFFSLFVLSSLGLQAQVKHRAALSARALLARSIARGKNIYVQNCLSCHQADGHGLGNMNPPLIQTSYVLGDKTKLITIVLNGFNEDVEINDKKYQNTMPTHDFLKDQEIADVLTYVRNNFTNKASRVTISEVKKVRATNKPPASS
jgi:mono/diheme cytochrome c family protein